MSDWAVSGDVASLSTVVELRLEWHWLGESFWRPWFAAEILGSSVCFDVARLLVLAREPVNAAVPAVSLPSRNEFLAQVSPFGEPWDVVGG